MNIDFSSIIKERFDSATMYEIANGVRTDPYIGEQLLPNSPSTSNRVDWSNMTITPTMSGIIADDSPYPPSGNISGTRFENYTVKIGTTVPLRERTLRELQSAVDNLQLSGSPTTDYISNTILNFTNLVLMQSLTDTIEYMRWEALTTGKIAWEFNRKKLSINYNIPSTNILTKRTGNDAYDGSSSKFWTDWQEALRLLNHDVRAVIMNPQTFDAIINNTVNGVQRDLSPVPGRYVIKRLVTAGDVGAPGTAEVVNNVIVYNGEGEILDPANSDKTKIVSFLPKGKVVFIGNTNRRGFRVSNGAQLDPNLAKTLGYTHIGPTVESGLRPGMWVRVYTPESKPYQLVGEAVAHVLPVIENPNKLVIAETLVGGV
jgi:hypothetical protein